MLTLTEGKKRGELTIESFVVHPLEQREHPERHGLLVEKLQRQACPRAGKDFQCYRDQPM